MTSDNNSTRFARDSARAVAGLNDVAATLLGSLPTELVPKRLLQEFPHVANRISDLWKRPMELDRYFDDLTIDRRGGRRGFPLGAALEITNLKDYYQTQVRPLRKTTWDFSV
jgi:hypothetical protein